ncbi:hypothetical protein TBLA_0A02060 [Henningerozyma blattae CBS 6284]|uniref:Small ribosomal subunit protein mS29 n=1 Tax=Henningerozyma blattae (strain ATCC 34711 / CBS 6284 / DSM 70876 / NBRC 10599 / NRRL Y-10934 / UCD 77-7) TaxID=1071380 RepID=I2GV55_HENB6|nr:hypothetical protein TBLA_0A02060 [Tetrapisispora blattae CBS 6284]CCH58007.1 hypothetical protein TBLA_0A02060 [Tetrapisispora blattae CBS 6284]
MLSLRTCQRQFATATILRAAKPPPARGKVQGFSRKKFKAGDKDSSKKISRGTLYKNWKDTVQTARLNKNAPRVPDMPTCKLDNLENIKESLNKVVNYTDRQYKYLHVLGAFKKDQFNELFKQPITLIRKDTTEEFIKLIESSKIKNYIITGEPGVGKSVLLSQTQAYAIENNFITLNVSYPNLFINGRNDFFFDQTANTYFQPMYLKQLLSKLKNSADAKVYESLLLKNNYRFLGVISSLSSTHKTVNFEKGKNSVLDLLNLNIQPRQRGMLFQAIIDELSAQDKYPVLLTIDNFSSLLTNPYTAYKDTSNKNIFLMDLQLGKILMNIIEGKINFKNPKSAVVLAISGVDRTNQTLPVGLGKLEEDVYVKPKYYEPRFSKILQNGGVQEFEVPKLNKSEVSQLIDFYIKSGIVSENDVEKTNETTKLIDEKYIISGNGNPRELLKSFVLSHS